MATQGPYSTPVNTITREALTVLITNNIMNNSMEFSPDCSMMDTISPVTKPNMHPVSKKLFHSPLNENCSNDSAVPLQASQKSRKAKKRKQILLPSSAEKMKKVFVTECERDGYSPGDSTGMRRKVLISLFHNKEYSMDYECGN